MPVQPVDPGFTSPGERRDYWPILRLLLVIVLVVLGARWVLRTYPVPFLDQSAYLEARQRDNDEILTFYVGALDRYLAANEGFPPGLVDILRPTRVPGGIARGIPPRDAWGHPLRYFSDGKIYLLVSVGRDGEPETEDYHEYRQAGSSRDVCDDPDADLVVSDRGWHRYCSPTGENRPGRHADAPGR